MGRPAVIPRAKATLSWPQGAPKNPTANRPQQPANGVRIEQNSMPLWACTIVLAIDSVPMFTKHPSRPTHNKNSPPLIVQAICKAPPHNKHGLPSLFGIWRDNTIHWPRFFAPAGTLAHVSSCHLPPALGKVGLKAKPNASHPASGVVGTIPRGRGSPTR